MVLAQLLHSTGALSNCQLSTGLFEPIGTGTISRGNTNWERNREHP